MALVITGGRVVTPAGVLEPGWLTVAGDRIEGVGDGPAPDGERYERVDLAGGWLVPGFVDIHCHGGGGATYSRVTRDEVATAAAAHRAHGTTTTLASLVSRPIPELVEQVSALAGLAADGLVAGIHLEGPFISTERRGAHDPAVLVPPDPGAIAELLDAGRGAVRMVTLAPELPGALAAVEQFAAAGVIVAIGHTNATEAEVRPAVDAGATVATHLFNGMRPLHHREPGPIGALLEDERVTVELICDLVHLAPTTVRLAAHHAGRGRTVLVTDAMAAAGSCDGVYEVGGRRVTVTGGVPTLDGGGQLAASTLTLDNALRNVVRTCGLDITDVVHAVSTRPAQLLGLTGEDGAELAGVLAPGAVADLVLLDADLSLTRVMHRGSWA
jgi:N-acetylglucosamine-6-phosphate deacetylase